MSSIGQRAARVLLGAATLLLLAVGLGPLTGAYRIATVLSGSMAPGMPVGSLAVLVPVEPAAVHVGDVITFQAPLPDHRIVTHRVVAITEVGPHPVIRTKGDANAADDPWAARLAGRTAWRRAAVIPGVGSLIRALRSAPVHHLTVHVVPVLLLAVTLLAIWRPEALRRAARMPRAPRGKALMVAALVLSMSVGLPGALAGFDQTVTATNTVASAADWLPPSVSTTVIAKQTGYLAGAIKPPGALYFVYANVADSGNPASGVSTVTVDVSTITAGQTAVALTSGSYTVNGVTYNYRSTGLT